MYLSGAIRPSAGTCFLLCILPLSSDVCTDDELELERPELEPDFEELLLELLRLDEELDRTPVIGNDADSDGIGGGLVRACLDLVWAFFVASGLSSGILSDAVEQSRGFLVFFLIVLVLCLKECWLL